MHAIEQLYRYKASLKVLYLKYHKPVRTFYLLDLDLKLLRKVRHGVNEVTLLDEMIHIRMERERTITLTVNKKYKISTL